MINDHGLPHFKITPYWPPKTPPQSVAMWQRTAPGGTDVLRLLSNISSSRVGQCIVAGGMSRGDGTPLRDRVRRGGAATEAGAAAGRAVDAGGRHCWVVDSPGHPGRWPGVLLEWRQADGRWEGLVAYVMPEPRGRGVRLVERWIGAGHLEPA